MAKDDDGDRREAEDKSKEPEYRGKDISKRQSIEKACGKIYDKVEKGFRDQNQRANEQMDYWDIYHCKLGPNQAYNGNSRVFVPIITNAVNARKTRFINQIFPAGGRSVEVISEDDIKPDAISSLLEHYILRSELRTKVMPALMKAGDIEGQYNVLVSWSHRKRYVTWRVVEQPQLSGGMGMENPAAEEVETIKEELVESQYPEVEVIPDSDICVLPSTTDSIDDAIEAGGSVTILRRWGKARIRRAINDGDIREDAGEALLEAMEEKPPGMQPQVNQPSKQVDAAGIKGEGDKHALVYLTYAKIKYKGKRRLCQIFFGGKDRILGCRLNPLWCDRVPLLSVPAEKVAGAFKGRSKIADVAPLQYAANDAINEAFDSAAYTLMPIILTDPEKNPRTGSMILSQAAIWETSPRDTQPMQLPPLWEKGFELVANCKNEVTQTLNVSPAAITQGLTPQTKGKRNQAEIAQEQQVDILTTADSVTVIEEGILTPLLTMFIELDHQYRTSDISVRSYGEMGLRAEMEKIPPLQMNRRYLFRWFGVERARSAQQIQQQISTLNVVQSAAAQAGPMGLRGYKLNLVPFIQHLFENAFGPRLAPQIFESPEQLMPVPAEQENMLLREGFEVPTHATDDDQQHLQAHGQLMQQMQQEWAMTGQKPDAKIMRVVQGHLWRHMQQMQQKEQQAMNPQPPPQPQPQKKPKAGAQAGAPRGGQNPPGMIPQDQMRDPSVMPRKAGGGLRSV